MGMKPKSAQHDIKMYSTREGENGKEIKSHKEFVEGGYYIDKAVECVMEDEKGINESFEGSQLSIEEVERGNLVTQIHKTKWSR